MVVTAAFEVVTAAPDVVAAAEVVAGFVAEAEGAGEPDEPPWQ